MASPVMEKVFSDRIGRIEVSATLAVVNEALKMKANGIDLADYGAGEPHFATPRHIKDAAIKAIEANFTRYTAVAGIPELRKALVERHAADFGTNYAPEESVTSTGGKLALFNALQVLADHGDEVILPVPYWTSFKDIIQYAGAKPVLVQTSEEDGFKLRADMVERAITDRTKVIIVNTPCNPTGAVVPREELEAIADMAHRRNIYLLSDECYVYLDYTGRRYSAGAFTKSREHILLLGSLSKTYAMTGWRIGYALGPKPIIDAMSKLQSQSTSNTNSITQKAGIAALTGSQDCIEEMCKDYISLRDQILRGFSEIPGITCAKPEGAFYVYPNVSKFFGRHGMNSAADVAKKLLHEAHVVTVPAEAFGTKEHIRLSYAVSHEEIDKGLARMKKFFASI